MTPARDLFALARLLLGYAALCAWERLRGTHQVEERIDPEDEPRKRGEVPRRIEVVDGCCGECDVCRPTVDA